MLSKQFTKEVIIFKYLEDGTVKTSEDGTKEQDHSLGSFVFRRPTIKDQTHIGIERAKARKGLKTDDLDPITLMLIEFQARFPYLVVEAPQDFDWENIKYDDIVAISNAFNDGMDELV